MKWNLLAGVLLLVLLLWAAGRSDWHLKRNKHNRLPDGGLKQVEDMVFEDEAGMVWELQPAIKNKFHQPDEEIRTVENPYPNVQGNLTFDLKNPNLKFLSKTSAGASFEAILQPNGEYLTTGKKQGTYNYGHPSGFIGTLKHVVLDVIPHFVNANYST